MAGLSNLPPELLSHIVDAVAARRDSNRRRRDKDPKYKLDNERSFSGLSAQNHELATTLKSDLSSLRNLRQVSRTFSDLCTPVLFRIVRVLPSPESATRYNSILESETLNRHVKKIVFQTRNNPDSGDPVWDRPGPGDDYDEPHDFFLNAIEQVGCFKSLTDVELVFSTACENDDGYGVPESIVFREGILEQFFAHLNHPDHPADKVHHLSIKNLQDMTPTALMSDEASDFKSNFTHVMSRIDHLSLQIATEYDSAAPENTTKIQECHDFFFQELQKYWLEPIRNNLVYLKLYATEMYWGYYPACRLPHFPKIKSLLLGNMSFANDKQVDWILSHGDTLEELILDDCHITIGGKINENQINPADHSIIYEPDTMSEDGERNHCIPREVDESKLWHYEKRWHDSFARFKAGLPHLKHFVIGHGKWGQHAAFDEADGLTSSLRDARYQFFDQGIGPSPWIEKRGSDTSFTTWMENDIKLPWPECDSEDWEALKDLVAGVRKRR